MNELIKISDNNGQRTVSARELHAFLEATERFSNWIDRQFQYGFIRDVDYCGCKVFNTLANQELIDFALTIDCAKEISMLQKSEKGKQARQYFIDCEKKLDTLTHPTRKQLAQWVIEQEEKIEQLEVANKDKEKQLAIAAPKVLFAESVQTSKNSILIGDLAKILKQNGINMGRDRLFQWLRDNGYLLKFGNEYNKPSQMAMELGLFEIKETVIENPDKEPIISFTTKVTGKGQLYFINKFLRNKAA